MASILLGGIIADIRGKLGALVFSRNKGGAYIRNNTVPINPATPLQEVLRSIFTNLVIAWREVLTPAERDAWAVYGENVTVKNRVGEDITLTGFNHYMRSNTPRIQSGLTRVDAAPATFSLADQDATLAFTASEATQDMSVVFDDTKPWASEDDAALIVYAGIPVDPTVNFFKGPWRLSAAIPGNLAVPITSPQVLTEPYPVVELQRQTIYGRISRADGRLSEKFLVRDAVAA